MPELEKIPGRHPENATFELTVRCNLHCKMCLFRHNDSENAEICRKELTADQWIDMARQAADMGTAGLLITGGEPMLRPDFPEIYEGIYKQGFIIQLYTNATLVTPEIMELFKRYPPHKIGVTIYGASPETYQKVCGNAKAFDKMIEGVHSLMTLPSVIDFRTTIIQDNFDDVGAIEDLIQSKFGNYHLTQTRMVMKAVRGGCAKVEDCRLSGKDNVYLAYRRGIEAVKKIIGDDFDEKYIRLKISQRSDEEACKKQTQERYTIFGCSGGMTGYTVTWDGKLQACQVLGEFSTNVLEKGLKESWDYFPYVVNYPPLDEKCQKCKMIDLCQCCPASRYAETGSVSGCPEYACEDAKRVAMLIEQNEK